MRYVSVFGLLIAGALIYRYAASPEWQDGLAAWGAASLKPLLVPLVELIATPAFVYFASLAIVVAAVAACATYWRQAVRPRLRRLRALRGEIAGLPVAHKGRMESRFTALHELGNLLRREGLFLSAWAGFQGQSARYGRIADAPFAHFASGDRTMNDLEHRGFMHALPGYFTTVGLILTFIGLVVALYFAAKGFRSGNMDEARTAILQLLNASAFKFVTSVAALGSALMISVFLRFSLSVLRRETAHTIAAVESYISEWRDVEGDLGFARAPAADVTEKLELLSEHIVDLNRELSLLRERIQERHEARV